MCAVPARRRQCRPDCLTGGLGPTEDDITRDAVARALNLPLDTDERIVEKIRTRFEQRGLVHAGDQPAAGFGAARSSRAGQRARNRASPVAGTRGHGDSVAARPAARDAAHSRACHRGAASSDRRSTRSVPARSEITGRPEADVDAVAQPVYSRWTSAPVPIATTILAKMGQIELHLTADAPNAAAADVALAAAVDDCSGARDVCLQHRRSRARGGRRRYARARGMTIAVAESCSGGLLSSRIDGCARQLGLLRSRHRLLQQWAKTEWLGVPEALISAHGAVSEPVAVAMAEGVCERASSSVGVGITGIAGPAAARPQKPVGTVAVAVVTPEGRSVRTFQFLGARDMVKFQSAQAAMNMLRLLLSDGTPLHSR